MTKKMSAGNTHHTESTPLRDVAEVLATSFRADGKSPKTIQGYAYELRLLDEHLQQTGHGSLHPSDVKAADTDPLTAHIRETRSPQTAVIVWNSLRAVWTWMLRRERVRGEADLRSAEPPEGGSAPSADADGRRGRSHPGDDEREPPDRSARSSDPLAACRHGNAPG